MTTALPKDIADKLERHIIDTVRARLVNWGMWWRRENNLEMLWDTGQSNRSPLHKLMQRGKVRTISGYATPHRMPVDDVDALDLHQHILTLRDNVIGELRRFYADDGGTGTQAQKDVRYRAVRKLAGIGRA